MNRMAPIFALTLALGIGISAAGARTAYAQPAKDPRVADLVQAGRLRVGLGLGTPAIAIKNPATGELRGPGLDLGRALAKKIGVDFVAVEYARPGAVLEGVKTNAWDLAFLAVDPERAKQADFAPPHMQSDFTYLVPPGSSIHKVADADQPGVRIAVPRGDASDLLLARLLKKATAVQGWQHWAIPGESASARRGPSRSELRAVRDRSTAFR